MKKIKKLAEYQYWNVVGLLALANQHRKQLNYIEEALADTLGISGELGNYGHVSDFVWGADKGGADRLLKHEGIELP